MRTENLVLMQMARESLKGKWAQAVGTYLVYIVVVGAFSGTSRVLPLTGIVSLILAGPMFLGITIFSLSLARNQDARIEQIFNGFYNFGKALGAYLLMLVFILLWSVLLVIPGIIAAHGTRWQN